MPFDQFAQELPPVGMVKIDVEGHELAVLKGMVETLRQDRPVVICELLAPGHETDEPDAVWRTRNETLRFVRELGFETFQIVKAQEQDLDISLRHVEKFPRFIYQEDPNACDFLFLPEQATHRFQDLIKS